jgi:hypothetical protein
MRWVRLLLVVAAAAGPIPSCGRGDDGVSHLQTSGCERDCVPTAATLEILEGKDVFVDGETLTFEATVSPAPSNEQNGRVIFYPTDPVTGPGAPVERIVDGIARRALVCGSDRVPHGSQRAQAQFTGTNDHQESVSPQIAYECLAD